MFLLYIVENNIIYRYIAEEIEKYKFIQVVLQAFINSETVTPNVDTIFFKKVQKNDTRVTVKVRNPINPRIWKLVNPCSELQNKLI